MSPWWKRILDPTHDPKLDRGRTPSAAELVAGATRLDAQERMARIAPPVLPTSPYADLAAARIRVECLERDVAELEHDLAREMDARKEADQAAFDECVAHGESRRELLRDLRVMQEQRDGARVAETMCSVSRCPRCQTDVECLPVGWWCDECTRAYPEGACAFGYAAVAARVNGLADVPPGVLPVAAKLPDYDEPLMEWEQELHAAAADPADTAKVGDPDPTPNNEPWCSTWLVDRGGQWCSRRPSHRGQHVAGDGRVVVAVWPNEPAADRRPCANCTDRVHALSARDWCDSCEGQDADELVEKARALGDEVGQRIVTGAALAAQPIGTVLLRQGPTDPTDVGRLHAIVRVTGGWWGADDQHAMPIDQSLSYAVLYVPGDVDEVRPVAGRDRTAAIEGAAITMAAHYYWPQAAGTRRCQCGWEMPDVEIAERRDAMCRHVAEQLAAVGALDGSAARMPTPHLVAGDKIRVRLFGDLDSGWWTADVVAADDGDLVIEAPAHPALRSRSFATGSVRDLADGSD